MNGLVLTVAAVVASVLLGVAMLLGGVMKVRRAPQVLDQLSVVGVSPRLVPGLGAIELAAVAGLVGGLVWWPLAVAAAAGCVLYFLGAVGAHLRVRDTAVGPALALLELSVATLVLLPAAQ